jgi:hypothetical protein
MNGDPRLLKEFATWDAEHDRLIASGLTSASTDTQVEAWTDREAENAVCQGWRLLHVQEAAHDYRDQQRARDWDRLAVVGADVAGLEETDVPCTQEELEPRRAERTKLVAAAIGWGRSDNEIAVRARTSRRTVLTLRESSTGATIGSKQKQACPGLSLPAPDTGSSSSRMSRLNGV